jgi:SAM-dependent methyltransferase
MPTRTLSPVAHDRAMAPIERLGLARQRALTLAGAAGRVLDVGAGTGLNLAHYPRGVTVVACEPDAARRARLEERAAAAPVPVDVVAGAVPGLAFDDGSFETVVCTLVLCTVEDLPGAIAELRRLLTLDGQLLFFEHVLGRSHLMAAVQRAVAPAWANVAGGCRLDRDVIAALRDGGFVISECERLAPLGGPTAGTVVRGRAIIRRSGP